MFFGNLWGGKVDNKICGWVSDVLYKDCIVGWLLSVDSTSPRDGVICLNGKKFKVKCDQVRSEPKKYKEHVNNGFRLKIDEKILKILKNKNEIILIDASSDNKVFGTTLKISDEHLNKLDSVIMNNSENLATSKSSVSQTNKINIFGKLNTKFSNFKITGWLAQKGLSQVGDDKDYRTALIKLDNGSSFTSIASMERADLQKKGIQGGKAGFTIDIPIEVISQLPKVFKAALYDKETNTLIDEVEYNNIELFSPKSVSEYLRYSMLNPVIYAPFKENHKRCFAFMEDVAAMLEKQDVSCLVSVIMPTYNREKFILESINSVLMQTYRNFELIIIDDASTDNTLKVVESVKDSRIVVLRNKENMGCSYSRNYGVQKARGKYIFYLDSDNTWDSRYLKVMMGAFKKLPNASALYSGQYLFRGNDKKCYAVRFASFNPSLLENRNYIDLNCFGHTKEAFDSVGGFNVNLRRLVDYDLILRLSKQFEIYSVPVLLSQYFFAKADNTITATETLRALKDDAPKSEGRNVSVDRVNVSAVIPSYETIDDLEECINSLVHCGCDEIIVVDNGSSENTITRLESLQKKNVIRLIKNTSNYGFTYAVNQGIRIAKPDNDILLVNNDSVYTKDSLSLMRKAAYSLKDVGLIVPRQVLYAGNSSITAHVPFADRNSDCDVNLSYHHYNIEKVPLFSNGKYIELSFAPFFCVYIRRDVYERAGDLDAQHGRHYRSDRLYCDVIRHILGLKIYYVADAVVYHKLQKSTSVMKKGDSKNYDLIFVQNKWSKEEQLREGFVEKLWE